MKLSQPESEATILAKVEALSPWREAEATYLRLIQTTKRSPELEAAGKIMTCAKLALLEAYEAGKRGTR